VISYGALDRMARAVAVVLQQRLNCADAVEPPRVVLLCKPGPGFIAGFLGCLYARVIAVPAYPVEHVRHLPRLRALLADAEPSLVLADSDLSEMTHAKGNTDATSILGAAQIVDINACLAADPEAYQAPEISPDDIAFLQYTSGSTGQPRGVTVTHGNLAVNAGYIGEAMGYGEEDVVVSWLPLYHDMGLIGTFMQSIFTGCTSVLMPPSAMLVRPATWWEAVSKYRATVTGAPNFAYALSARRVSREQLEKLDLSSLRVTFNGAEPVRADTMTQFAAAFAPAKFNPATLFPCYGLAEVTLFASGGPCLSGVKTQCVSRDGLSKGHIEVADTSAGNMQTLVGCGPVARGLKLRIVNPDTGKACKPGHVGEIRISGPSVSPGYWKKPEVNAEVFAKGELRTGDLGALVNGELYITGRIKDVIILAGKNHYPQDIEATAERAHEALRPGCVVAYGTNLDDPKLGIVAELRAETPSESLPDIAQAIARAVSTEHAVPVSRVTLIPAGRLPKTSSGKLQRGLTREKDTAGELDALYQWEMGGGSATMKTTSPGEGDTRAAEEAETVNRLLEYLRWYGANRMNSRLMDERRCFAPHVVLDLGNAGLLGMLVPENLGGLGLGAASFLAIGQQICSMDLTVGLFWGLNSTLAAYPLLRAGSPEQQQRFLPPLAQGRIIGSFALSEPVAGSNPLGIQSAARETAEGHWTLNGEKTWIGGGAWAGVITAFAKEYAADGSSRGMTGFVIEQGRKGLRQGPEHLTLGHRATVQNRLFFEDLPLDERDRLGNSSEGMQIAADTMNLARFGLGVMALGGAKRAMQLGMRYASRRTVNTGVLAEHPLVVGDLGDAALGIAALEALLKRCAQAMDAAGGIPDVDRVPEAWPIVAKVFGSELCGQVVDRAMQLAGGRGYIETNVLAQLWRDARILRIFEGPTETLEYHLGNLVARGHLDACLAMHRAEGVTQWAERLRDDLKALQERCPDRHLYRSLAGKISMWAILAMILREDAALDPLNGPSLDWVERQYKAALSEAELRASGLAVVTGLRVGKIVAGYADAIGDVEQTLPAEEWELDPMLRKDDLTVAAAAPALPPRAGMGTRVAVPQPRSFAVSAAATTTVNSPTTPANWRSETVSNPSTPPRRVPPRRPGSGSTSPVAGRTKPVTPIQSDAPPRTTEAKAPTDLDAISRQIVEWFCRSANVSREFVPPDAPLVEIGLDSLTAAEIAALIEETYDIKVQQTLLWDLPTIRHVAEYVAGRM